MEFLHVKLSRMEDTSVKSKPRISITTAILMLCVAFFYDILQPLLNLIPILGQILSYFVLLCSFCTFNIVWFHVCHIRFTEQFIGGRSGKWVFLKILAKFGIPVLFEILTVGVAPGITLWILFTILTVRSADLAVEKGIVTNEQLDQLDDFVIKTGKKHGFKSKEFRKELGVAIGHEVGKKTAEHIPERLASAKVAARYQRINDKRLKNVPQNSVHELDLKNK